MKNKLNNYLISEIDSATAKWFETNTPQNIQDKIFKLLDAACMEVIAKLLGFDNHWGKWEIDHCNNRRSPIKDYIVNLVSKGIKNWVDQYFAANTLPAPNKEQIKAFKNEYIEEFNRNLKNLARQHAHSEAETVFKEIVDSILPNQFDTEIIIKKIIESINNKFEQDNKQ